MPLQNRVLPNGDIVAQPWRGTMMGNRGGKIHDPATRLLHPTRRWASKQWICCKADFNERQRVVMGHSYTELFFLDEVTALAAGHRPCFECRRQEFHAYAQALSTHSRQKERMRAPEMDSVLHRQRLVGRTKSLVQMLFEDLPNGAAFIGKRDSEFYMKINDRAVRWRWQGYEAVKDDFRGQTIACLTPALNLEALRGGYQPQWHASIEGLAP